MADRIIGTVRWFSQRKGYGFIKPDENPSQDIFVHHSAITGEGARHLAEGQRVEFGVLASPIGTQAVAVMALEGSSN